VLPLSSLFNPNPGGEDFFSRDFISTALHNLAPAVGPAAVAFLACAVLTPLGILVARRIGFLALPRDRDIHTRPIPLGGGVALYLAFAAGCLAFMRGDPSVRGLLLLGGLTVLFFLVDDRFGIPALVKLGVQISLAVVAVVAFSFRIDFLVLPLLRVPDLGLLVLPVTVFWIVGMQNTANLLDGVDGLAAGVVGITALVLLVAAGGRQPEVVALSAALAGACGGFLLFNFHPARVFMGDSGAYFLGLALALLSVLGVAKVAVAAAIVVPLLALGIPIADTALAIYRRRRNGHGIVRPDTQHLHHQLLGFGLTQRETCILFYCTSGILGSIGLTAFGHRRILAVAIVFIVVLMSTALGERMRASHRRVPVPFGRVMRLLLEGRGLR
jgi:UDP-GlcNAc:undecaprenyl-phosphate GlcNAc-1-phosphate transferase